MSISLVLDCSCCLCFKLIFNCHLAFNWVLYLAFVSAAKAEHPFPDISFSAFSQIIESNFSSQMSLAAVLTILFILTENVDLLNLYFQQQHPKYKGENKIQATI